MPGRARSESVHYPIDVCTAERGRLGIMSGRFKWKHLWWAVVAAIGAVSYFDLPLPRGWSAWLLATDLWLINHTVYPGLFILFVVLLVATILVPEALRRLRAAPQQEETVEQLIDRAAAARAQAEDKLRRRAARRNDIERVLRRLEDVASALRWRSNLFARLLRRLHDRALSAELRRTDPSQWKQGDLFDLGDNREP